MTAYKALRVVFSILLIPTGAVLILLGVSGPTGNLLSNLGLALIVAGVVSSFQEIVLQTFEKGETADAVAESVIRRLQDSPLQTVGIRLISPIRKGMDRYYLWAIADKKQTLFFAGRSVLHRIDYDFRFRGLGPAEKIIARRLSEAANIRIMFLDPRCDMISRLAKEENQSANELYSDLATTIGICERLYNSLKDHSYPSASLDIRLYDEVPYFAYHRVDDNVIAGFYFSSALGHSSAAYEIVDQQTRSFLEGHFISIFERARETWLLQIPVHRDRAEFNHTLFSQLKKALAKPLGEERLDQLLKGGRLPTGGAT
jgi:hypothetical protein